MLKNIGTGHLSTELSERLISSVRRQLPNISGFVNKSIMDLKKELEAMVGGRRGQGRGRGSALSWPGWRAVQWLCAAATCFVHGAQQRSCLFLAPLVVAGRPRSHLPRRDDPPGAHALPQV